MTPYTLPAKWERITTERAVTKALGGKGLTDTWRRGFLARKYKDKRKDIADVYSQLVLYAVN